MDRARWERIQALFHRALAQGEAERRAFLEAECGGDGALLDEVGELLASDARGSALLDGGISPLARAAVGTAAPPVRQIGPYRLGRLLGEGGMGVVYLAERDDLRSRVAIKLLPDAWLSPARRARFLQEQRTLARLDHPSIARIHDADALEDGTPWFAMEYVEGEPITDRCARAEAPVEERVRLFRAACEAVSHAHASGVIHRDLKPAHVLVKADGSVRLLDFGIAKLILEAGAPPERTQTGLGLVTPAYAAPEQLRGAPATVATDVYALGVILYELLAGRRPHDLASLTPAQAAERIGEDDPERPSLAARRAPAPGSRAARADGPSWSDLDVVCLKAMHRDPARRYPTVAALVRDLDHLLGSEPVEARGDSPAYRTGKWLRRHQRALSGSLSALVLVGGLAFALGRSAGRRGPPPAAPRARAVAVVPFQNTGGDGRFDFLRLALPGELAAALGASRALLVRPAEAAQKYAGPDLDLGRVGRELAVDAVVTGRISREASGLQVALDLRDVATRRLLWQGSLEAPEPDLIALRRQLDAAVRGGLAAALGSAAPGPTPPHPSNEEAYGLYLRNAGFRYDPGPNAQGLALLERAVALDPGYAPAWLSLARRYYVEARYGEGASALMERYVAATERALALDPEYITAAARLGAYYAEQGDLVRAWRTCQDLVRRRPDSPDAHFWLGYVLRYAGLVDESARECETAVSLDPHNFGWRSCFYSSLARGDPRGAMAYLDLDPGSEFHKALALHALAWEGREQEALAVGRPHMPGWKSLDLLRACLEHRPPGEVAALARSVTPVEDPETNYLAAGHLAYCGQAEAALRMLRRSVEGGYCAVPAMDSDRLLASVRALPGFAGVRALGSECQRRFLEERARTAE